MIQGTNAPLEEREAAMANRSFLASLAAGILLAAVFFLTQLGSDASLKTRLYGTIGVLVFTTVMIFGVFTFVLAIRRRVVARRNRYRF